MPTGMGHGPSSHAISELLRNYPELGSEEQAFVRQWVRKARYVHLSRTLVDPESARNLSRAREKDQLLGEAFRHRSDLLLVGTIGLGVIVHLTFAALFFK